MSQLYKNPITQDISFRVDVEGIQVQCIISVTAEKKYPFERMARIAECIKMDIKDDLILLKYEEVEEETDDTL
jgi:hypothetical protein